MLNIGLLYSAGDTFTLQRSDIFVGPMLLAGANLIRFTSEGIDSNSGRVEGQCYAGTHWVEAPQSKLSAILDLSISASIRSDAELALLSSTPHSRRLDADRMEVQEALSQVAGLGEFILEAKPLDTFDALWSALNSWGTVVVKRRHAHCQSSPLVITPEQGQFRINMPWSEQRVDRASLLEIVEPLLGASHYLQPFMQSTTSDGKPMTLQVVLNQRHGGTWRTPAVRGIVASDSVLASLNAGGIFAGSPLVGKAPLVDKRSFSRGWSSGVNNRVQCFAVAVAHALAVFLKGPPALLGMRLGLDPHNRPHLISLDNRPISNRSPGRDLELYRHVSEFMVQLASEHTAGAITSVHNPTSPRSETMPDSGVGVCSFSPQAALNNLVSLPAAWFDVSLAHGGRNFLNTLGDHFKSLSDHKRPFLSLRLGHALNDAADGRDMRIYGSSAIEDYVGQGFLSYDESEFMRSLRPPLLTFQLDRSLHELRGVCPDMLWLEDADLSISTLSDDSRDAEATKTAAWFEGQCQRLKISSWGVMVNNPHSERALAVVETLLKAAGTSGHLRYIGTKANKVDAKVIDRLTESGLQPVLIAKELDATAAANALNRGCKILARWSWNGAASMDAALLAAGEKN